LTDALTFMIPSFSLLLFVCVMASPRKQIFYYISQHNAMANRFVRPAITCRAR